VHARTYLKLLATAAVVVVLDQVTKSIALENFREPVEVIPNVLTFRLTFNSGGAFGLLQGLPELFLIATIVAATIILMWVRHIEDPAWIVPLGLVFGGGVGNVVDRVLRDTDGRVVDWIELPRWPVFNIADSCIVIGVLLIFILGVRADRKRGREDAEVPAE
jgi:signal peptidase II